MGALSVPLWAHVVTLVVLAVAILTCGFVTWLGERQGEKLRTLLGQARIERDSAEILSEAHRKESFSRGVRVGALTKEVERYRGKLPMDMRLTRVAMDPG